MKLINQLRRFFLFEILILMLYVFAVNNYIGNEAKRINADGVGYYDYLPSIFLIDDLNRKDSVESSEIHDRVSTLGESIYVDYNGHLVNKYPCGTALLQLPFFALTLNELTPDEIYSDQQQDMVYFAALFYLLLGLVFTRKLLESYSIKWDVVVVIQLLIVFGTTVTNLANNGASGSHVYSFFAVTAFFYFTRMYLLNLQTKHFIFACLFLGVVLLIRQINILALLALPLLSKSLEHLWSTIVSTLKKPLLLISGITVVIVILSIQSLLWYYQTGYFVIDSYPDESFDFLKPQMFNVLFSYRAGLFVYSPILLFNIIGLVYAFLKKQHYIAFSWFGFAFVFTYIISSWWDWHYGCGLGMRVYTEYLSILFLPLALFLNQVHRIVKFSSILLAFALVPVNLTQSLQFRKYIIDWCNMNEKKYWRIFMKTENKYMGAIWEDLHDYKDYKMIEELDMGRIEIKPEGESFSFKHPYQSVELSDRIGLMRLVATSDFKEEYDASIFLTLVDTVEERYAYWHEFFLLQFKTDTWGALQEGVYNCWYEPVKNTENIEVQLEVSPRKQTQILENLKLQFFVKKQSIEENSTEEMDKK